MTNTKEQLNYNKAKTLFTNSIDNKDTSKVAVAWRNYANATNTLLMTVSVIDRLTVSAEYRNNLERFIAQSKSSWIAPVV